MKKSGMNIHEYQAKALLGKFGVAVPRGPSPIRRPKRGEAAQTLGGTSGW